MNTHKLLCVDLNYPINFTYAIYKIYSSKHCSGVLVTMCCSN